MLPRSENKSFVPVTMKFNNHVEREKPRLLYRKKQLLEKCPMSEFAKGVLKFPGRAALATLDHPGEIQTFLAKPPGEAQISVINTKIEYMMKREISLTFDDARIQCLRESLGEFLRVRAEFEKCQTARMELVINAVITREELSAISELHKDTSATEERTSGFEEIYSQSIKTTKENIMKI